MTDEPIDWAALDAIFGAPPPPDVPCAATITCVGCDATFTRQTFGPHEVVQPEKCGACWLGRTKRR